MVSNQKIFLLVLVSFVQSLIFAQNQTIFVEKIGLEEGLSQSIVTCIFQDKSGILWIGTQDGLNKYDGYSFTAFRHEPFDSISLSSNYIRDIDEDENGNLWIATQIGLNKYSKTSGKFQVFLYDINNPKSISNNIIFNVLVDSDNRIWILTSSSLDEYIEKDNCFEHYKYFIDSTTYLSDYNNLDIYEDSKKRIWLGTKDGLNYFDKNTEKFKRYYHSKISKSSLSNSEITTIYEDNDNNLWVGTQNGLNKFNQNSNTFEYFYFQDNKEKINENVIKTILQVAENEYWVGTEAGLKKFSLETKKIDNFPNLEISNIEERISAVICDFSGIFWVSGWNGIYKMDTRTKKFNLYNQNYNYDNKILTNSYIYSFFMDNNENLWLGSLGINIIDRKNKKNYNCNTLNLTNCFSDYYIYCFYQTGENNLLIGTNNGIYVYNLDKNVFIDFDKLYHVENEDFFKNNRITEIIEDERNNLWIASFNGLLKINKNQAKYYTKSISQDYGLTSNEVYSLLIDKQKNIWIGTLEGLNRYDKESDKFVWFTYNSRNENGLSNNSVLDIYEDDDSIIWIGTESGLNKFDKKNEIFDSFTCKKNGFVNDYIYSILEDENQNLWLSTNKGVIKFNKNDYHITTYGIKDGLQDYEFNLGAKYKSSNGELFFGGVKGFNSFFPDSMIINDLAPKTVITKFIIRDKFQEKEIYFDSLTPIKLDYHTDFTIYFTVPEYTKPENNQFQYKLEGINEEWSVASNQHFANFSELKPGTYTFFVRGANCDLKWNSDAAKLSIDIIPPIYMTNWAYFLYILLGLMFLISIFLYITRSIRIENQILNEKTKIAEATKKHKEELEIINKNITDSIHYAKVIIDAMLPHENILKKILPESFIFFKPKDIVSGDFYWFTKRNNFIFIAAVDCTGHGVPGAFMSIVGIELFRNIINKGIHEPSEILNKMNDEVADIFGSENSDNTLKDGMDLAFCVIDKNSKKLSYSGAYNPLYLIRDNSLIEFKADRFSVGLISKNENKSFGSKEYHLQNDDVIYLFSDGYTDQFGGIEAKKFKFRRFRHLLLSIHKLPFDKQKNRLNEAYLSWKGNYEQVDDILIIGFKLFTDNEYKENYF